MEILEKAPDKPPDGIQGLYGDHEAGIHSGEEENEADVDQDQKLIDPRQESGGAKGLSHKRLLSCFFLMIAQISGGKKSFSFDLCRPGAIL